MSVLLTIWPSGLLVFGLLDLRTPDHLDFCSKSSKLLAFQTSGLLFFWTSGLWTSGPSTSDHLDFFTFGLLHLDFWSSGLPDFWPSGLLDF